MSDDYSDAAWRFPRDAVGVHASHRSANPEPARFYEVGRFGRAKKVYIEQVGPRQFIAASQSRKGVTYAVDLDTMQCDCEDKFYAERVNNGKCKHILRCLMQEWNPAVLNQMVSDNERLIAICRQAGLPIPGEEE